ncbi:MAG: TetR/AcrR family transcriptional regulator [Deltaproteobacteria bacterium]|nr:MAG: TetR/AcrR family transcriptional regulator [Deltaproteobacteria bacterium]
MANARTERQKDEKRERILRAAWALIRHYGYQKTTMDDIAREAGVGKGTVYNYFGSKQEIMLALTDLTNRRILEEVERIASGSEPPLERLRRCVLHRLLTLFDLVQKYPHSQDVIASLLPAIVERLKTYVERHGAILGRIVGQGCAGGAFACEDPEATGRLLAELFEFMTPPYYRFKSKQELEAFANRTLDLVLAGLKKRHG